MQVFGAGIAIFCFALLFGGPVFGATEASAVARVKVFVEPMPKDDSSRPKQVPALWLRPGEGAVWARSMATQGWWLGGELRTLKVRNTSEGRIELHGGIRDDGDARVVRLYLISWPE